MAKKVIKPTPAKPFTTIPLQLKLIAAVNQVLQEHKTSPPRRMTDKMKKVISKSMKKVVKKTDRQIKKLLQAK